MPATDPNPGDTLVWNGSGWQAQNEMVERGFLAWNAPIGNANGVGLFVTQNEIAVKVPLLKAISCTSVTLSVSTAGSTLTSGQNLVTVYSAAGVLIGQTASQDAVWNTAGTYTMALASGPFALSGPYVWVGILSNGTTPATFRCLASTAALANAGGAGALAGQALRSGRIGAAVTAPASFTPANLVITNAFCPWVALS